MTKIGVFGFAIHLIIGIYLLNVLIDFIPVPEVIFDYNSWIIFVGGVFVIMGGINYFRVKKLKGDMRRY